MRRSTILKLAVFTLLSAPFVVMTVLMPPVIFAAAPSVAAFAAMLAEA